jgi:hypothetical protein
VAKIKLLVSSLSSQMTEPSEPSQVWSLAAIRDCARGEFRLDLEELEKYELPKFEGLADEATCLQRRSHTAVSWNVGMIKKIALVGVYDKDGSTQTGKKVFAYVYGDNRNLVGYVLQESRHTYIRLAVELDLYDVLFNEPFADVVDISGSPGTNHSRLRALLCYLFLKAGVIEGLKWYSAFPKEFKAACAWIGNDGERPLPAGQLPTLVLHNNVHRQTHAESDYESNAASAAGGQQERITRSQRSKKGREETSTGEEPERECISHYPNHSSRD